MTVERYGRSLWRLPGAAGVLAIGCAVVLTVLPGCFEQDREQQASGPSGTFNSRMKFEVRTLDDNKWMRRGWLGRTPSRKPIVVPSDMLWYVDTERSVDMAALCRELRAKDVPGLQLGAIRGGPRNLVHLRSLTKLRYLCLLGTGHTDADLVHIKGLTKLEELCPSVRTDAGLVHMKDLTQLRRLRLVDMNISGTGLAHLKGLTKLRRINFDGSQITDAALAPLKDLTKLEALDLSNTNIGDAGLAHVKGVTQLRRLWLHRAEGITDAGLAHLGGLANLQDLSLSSTKITGSGLVHLKGLTKLRRLNLWGSEITDAALPQLKDLTQLKELGVEVAEVTRAGVAELKKALPNTRIGHINDLPWLPLGGIESQP